MTMKNTNAYSVGTYGDHLSAEKADSCKKRGLLSARHAWRFFILCLLLAFVLCGSALAGDGYLTVSGKYNGGYDQQFIYHDDMLLADASSGVSPEIAKVSVSLAGAAYQPDYINGMLEQMGFTYENFQFTERTINYNDLVAYTIGTKPIGDKMAFIVAVRGSSGNAEWFSNFNVGATESGDHAGFHTAAKNVSESLAAYLTNYPVDDRIVLVTGHSRGGAVANIVAAKLLQNDMVPENQLFGYTYACPNVSTNYDTSLNIHNFNITGDMVPEVPLAKWGYGCHGTTHDIIAPEGLYKNLTGKEYAGASVSTMYQDAFLQIAPTAQLLDEPFHQFLVMTAAYTMGGKADATVEEVAAKYLKNNGMTIAEKVIDKVIDKITGVSDIKAAMEHAKELYEAGHKLAEQLQKETEGMTPEEFEEHREKNLESYNELMGLTGEIIADSASFSPTITILLKSIQYADEAGSLAGDFYALLEDTSYANPLDSVLDAHLMPIYTLWVNHEYYGYRGRILDSRKIRVPDGVVTIAPYCFADSDITGFTADSLIYISEYSFRDAANLETVEIPNSVTYIGSNAFRDCTGLKYITLPIEQSLFGAFTGCRNVQTITYTVQADGVMPARTSDSCTNTLEYICRESVQKIVYGEGVTEIADYANYNTYYSQLSEVQFPETLKRIGQSAFYKAAMYWLQLPESLEEIGDNAFFDCNTKHVNIPAALTKMGSNVFASCGNLKEIEFGGSAVGEYWFKDCTALETLVIPNTVTSISTGAFNNCTGLKYVTLPIEQSGFGAFTGCRNVLSITYTAQSDGVMPARTSSTYSGTLEYICRQSVQKIVYEEGVTEIADYANFHDNYSQLSNVTFPETLKRIGMCAFYKVKLYWMRLPESVEEIGDAAFRYCNQLNMIFLNKGLKSIGSTAFDIGATYRLFIVEPDTTASQFCADKKYPYTAPVDFSLSMKSNGVLSITRYNGSGGNVVIPEYISIYPVTAIEGTAFAGHEEITGVQISNRVSRIDDTAFDQATLNVLCKKDSFAYNWAVSKGYYLLPCCFTPDFEIQEAVLPGCFETGMTEGKHCKHCGTVLSVPEEVPAAGHTVVLESTFYETVPGSALEIPIGFSCGGVCGTQAHWCDRSEPTVMDVENGMITYTADESGIRILEMWPGEEKNNAVSCVLVIHTADRMTLPASLQEIGEEAFVGLATREFVLPDGMTGIASRAFAECANLSMITIPDSVVNIADDAFDGSTGVTIICGEGSAAAAHAGTHEIPCIEIPINKGN